MRRAAQVTAVAAVLALLGLLVWDVVHQSGGKVARSVDSGKVVVLNFWQSYCPPCTREAPVFAAAARKWSEKDVVFVGIDEQDLRGPALKFIKRFDITYPIVADSGALVGHYGVTGYPETFFIDRRGRVVPAVPGGHIIGPATVSKLAQGIRNAFKE